MHRNTKIALGVGAVALVVLFVAPLLAFATSLGGMGAPMDGGMWSGPMHDGHAGGLAGDAPVWFALVGVASQLAFVALLAAGGYLLYRAVASDSADPALEELRRAYARGDIDDDEYDRRRDRLEDDP